MCSSPKGTVRLNWKYVADQQFWRATLDPWALNKWLTTKGDKGATPTLELQKCRCQPNVSRVPDQFFSVLPGAFWLIVEFCCELWVNVSASSHHCDVFDVSQGDCYDMVRVCTFEEFNTVANGGTNNIRVVHTSLPTGFTAPDDGIRSWNPCKWAAMDPLVTAIANRDWF